MEELQHDGGRDRGAAWSPPDVVSVVFGQACSVKEKGPGLFDMALLYGRPYLLVAVALVAFVAAVAAQMGASAK